MTLHTTEQLPPSEYEVRIKLFGNFEIENHLGRVAEDNPKRAALSWLLLKYMVVNRGREVDLDELLGTIWPDERGANAENAARVRLNRLRTFLKPLGLDGRRGLVLYHAQKYTLNPLYTIRTDAEEFMELMAALRSCPIDSPSGLELCKKALELFRGPYMKHAKKDFWFAGIQEAYDEEFNFLAFNTLERMEATGSDTLLPLLSQRALDILPDNLELHKQILNCFSQHNRETERKCHTTLLMRAGVVSNWLNAM